MRVEQRVVPDDWPPGQRWDLVVISELAYYFDETTLRALSGLAVASIRPGGVLVAVHWTGETDYPLSGRAAQRLLGRARALQRIVHHDDEGFVLDVWRRR